MAFPNWIRKNLTLTTSTVAAGLAQIYIPTLSTAHDRLVMLAAKEVTLSAVSFTSFIVFQTGQTQAGATYGSALPLTVSDPTHTTANLSTYKLFTASPSVGIDGTQMDRIAVNPRLPASTRTFLLTGDQDLSIWTLATTSAATLECTLWIAE